MSEIDTRDIEREVRAFAQRFRANGGSAFPSEIAVLGGGTFTTTGLTIRDWFAGQALIALGQMNPNLPGDAASDAAWPDAATLATRKAAWAYLVADAMLAHRSPAPSQAETEK